MIRAEIISTTQQGLATTSVMPSEAGVIIVPWAGRDYVESNGSGAYELTDTLFVPVGSPSLLSVIASVTVAQPVDIGSQVIVEGGTEELQPMTVVVGEETQFVYNQSGGVCPANYNSEAVITIFGTFAFIPSGDTEVAIRFGVSFFGNINTERQAYWEGAAAVFVKYGSL